MAARDLKIFLRTFSDATGLTRLGQHIKAHSITVRGLAAAYKATGAAGKAAFSLISSQLRMIRNAAAVTAAALTGIAIKGVSAFMKQDDAAKSLEASLASLGYDADRLMPRFTRLADEIQRLTRIGDDKTLGLAGTLLNFGVTPEKIEPAIRGTIGLATAMRMDLGSAAQYLALAYEGQFTMLARYIPALRTATDDAEKMAIVQGVMARGFEQAQAAAGTLSGRWDQLKNRIDDLWGRIGQAVAEALNLQGAFAKAERAVNSLIESAVWDRITTGLRNAVGYVVTQVKTAYDTAGKLKKTMDDVDAQWQKSKENIRASGRKASGGEFDWSQRAADNRAELETFFNADPAPPPSAPGSKPPPAAPRKSRAQLERELAELQMQAIAAKMDQDYAAGQTPEEQRYAQWQRREGQRNYSPRSHEYQKGQDLGKAAATSRQEADQAAKEAAAALVEITGLMKAMATGLKDMQGQIRNMPD